MKTRSQTAVDLNSIINELRFLLGDKYDCNNCKNCNNKLRVMCRKRAKKTMRLGSEYIKIMKMKNKSVETFEKPYNKKKEEFMKDKILKEDPEWKEIVENEM